ncbi:MAG: type II toxin-antitoxin system VapC family toxin [Acidobacteria bacterium]|nr:type II toxin-antitoxin system VapC family toxin [Acidobacteriota bacterium]
MSALVLDAGAFLAVERNDRTIVARLRAARKQHVDLRTTAIVLGQVWRDPQGRQTRLARLLRAVDVRPVDEQMGRRAGVLLARAGTSDPIDATVVLVAESGDRILTSDPSDIQHLVAASGTRVATISC